LSATTAPRLPLTVKAGNPRPTASRVSVYDRAFLPPATVVPRHDLPIGSKTAQQQQSFPFGGTCPHDLWTGPHALRFPNRPSPTPTSPGQDTGGHLTRR
jgi:hypothetical protein